LFTEAKNIFVELKETKKNNFKESNEEKKEIIEENKD